MPTSTDTVPRTPVTRQRALLAAVILLAVLTTLLALSPPERQLGNLVKIIYLHGALARSGMYGIMGAGLLGLLYLLRPRPALLRWSNGLQVSGMILFIVHFLLSIIPTYQTWGMLIAFDEPRTIMSLQIVGVGLLVIVVRYLLREDRLSALANLLLGAAVALLSIRTGVLRHPLNPIGESSSAAIQVYYVLIVAACLGLLGLLAWWLVGRGGATNRGANDPS